MKRIIALFLLLSTTTLIHAEEFKEGKDYVVLSGEHDVIKDKKTIKEFFSYGCPWCYKIDPVISKWADDKKASVELTKVPVVFNKDWAYYAKAYYTAKALGLSDDIDTKLFTAILKDKKKLNSNSAMVDYFVQEGVSEDIAKSAFENAPSIDMELEKSKREMSKYRVNVVPTLVINGKYKTDLQMAENEQRLIEIINYLLTK